MTPKRALAGLALLLFLGAPGRLLAAAAPLEPAVAPVVDGDFHDDGRPSAEAVELGRLLFFDKILSGNRNISCATCHHPRLASGDRLSLPIGEGGRGLGPARRVDPATPVLGRVPRNSQALFFVGARQYRSLFHDGRVEVDPAGTYAGGFWTPAREQLPAGLANVLAAQALFPVLSHAEMAGHKGENEVATAAARDQLAGPDGAWELLARRLRAVRGYVGLFKRAFPDRIVAARDITFVDAANAIAAFEAVAFRADGSPFDAFLRSGDLGHLDAAAQRGLRLFYGKAACAGCHSGKLQTDNDFHAIAMPQIGPGKGHGRDSGYWQASGFAERLEDEGRYRVSFDPNDRFRFRTPSLRNVALTGPWGHAGSYASLEAVVRHHADARAALAAYDARQSVLPAIDHVIEKTAVGSRLLFRTLNPARLADWRLRDHWVLGAPALVQRIAAANELPPRPLSDREVDDLVAFLHALTDPASRDLTHLIPAGVPSGLPVED